MASSSDSKIAELADEGRTTAEIAAILGMNHHSVQRTCTKLGLSPPRRTTAVPYGITDASYALRMQLGSVLVDMRQKKSITEMKRITGLNTQQLVAAEARPYRHDWTLSQIERTLAYDNKTIKEVL